MAALTPEQIEQAVKKAIDDALGKLYVNREQHYKDHEFISGLRELSGDIRSTVLRTVIRLLVVGAVALLVLGIIFWGKGNIIN